jgi:hypothetical protein
MKSLFISLLIIALVSVSVQGLKMNSHLRGRESHFMKTFGNAFSHKLGSMAHLGAAASDSPIDIPPEVLTEFITFAMSDKDIADSMMNNKTLSKQSTKKIQNWFVNNQKFNDAILKSLESDPDTPKCFKNLKPGQKKKIVKIIIQSIDFDSILNDGDTEPSDAEINAVKDSIRKDPELGDSVVKCFDDVENSMGK